jgi:CubicO group peptidase (beta-lactamase class C family)
MCSQNYNKLIFKRLFMNKITTVIACWLFIACNSTAQAPVKMAGTGRSPLFLTDSLDKYIERGMQMWRVPGMAVAIIKDGKIVYMKGHGRRWEWGRERVDENTLFMIGSCTKAFTSTALAMLQNENKLKLDDKMTRWMPQFRLHDAASTELVTVRDVLCHRLGLETFQGDFTHWDSNLNRGEIIGLLAKHRPKYPFRTTWGYCNAGYLAAGELIPTIAGKSWDDFIKERLLIPLNMKRTFTHCDSIMNNANAARPHTIVESRMDSMNYPHIDNFGPAASMSASISDMTHWVTMLLDSGRLNGKQIVPASVIQETWKPQTIMNNKKNKFVNQNYQLYGLGWVLEDYNGKEMISHTGGVDGFLTSVVMVPSEKLGIIVLTNQDNQNLFHILKNEITDYYMGLPFRDYSYLSYDKFAHAEKDATDAIMKERLKCAAEMKVRQPSALKFDDYVGTYTNEIYGEVTVTRKENRLKMSFSKHPNLIGHLESQGNHNFLCFYSNKILGIHSIPFKMENGKITGFTLRVNDFVEMEPYPFTKK